MQKKAKYFKVLPEKKIKCTLCPHECILLDGQTGICRARKNIDGTLKTLVFSNPCAVNIDPVEKKPLYHFLPGSKTFSVGTAGCSLSCKNCQNYTISQANPQDVNNYYLEPQDIVTKAIENNCSSISYTYTEPMVFFEYMLETAKLAHKNNLKNIIVSSGFVNQTPLEELIPHIDAANIDLKSFDDEIYKKLSSARLQPILNTLLLLKKHKIHLEITSLIIPEYTDDLKMIEKMSNWLHENQFDETALHFSKFFPTYKLSESKITPNKTIEKAIAIAENTGIKYVYAGNMKSKKENTYCPNCDSILIEREGFFAEVKNFNEGKCNICGKKIAGIWAK